MYYVSSVTLNSTNSTQLSQENIANRFIYCGSCLKDVSHAAVIYSCGIKGAWILELIVYRTKKILVAWKVLCTEFIRSQNP